MSDFIATQKAFVAAIKQPENFVAKDSEEERRIAIYQSLFFNNVDGFVSSAFPVLKSLYSEKNWQMLIRSFFSSHHCRSPYFAEISKEFVEFLDSEYNLSEDEPAFIKELAHYEWLELDVSIRKTGQQATPFESESLPSTVCMSDLASVVSYTYPVHQIQADFQPEAPLSDRVYFVVYRDSNDDVQFVQINAMTAFLLSQIESYESRTIDELLEASIEVMPGMDPDLVAQGMSQTLMQLLQSGVLLPNC